MTSRLIGSGPIRPPVRPSKGGSYPSAEVQSAYSTAPADRANDDDDDEEEDDEPTYLPNYGLNSTTTVL